MTPDTVQQISVIPNSPAGCWRGREAEKNSNSSNSKAKTGHGQFFGAKFYESAHDPAILLMEAEYLAVCCFTVVTVAGSQSHVAVVMPNPGSLQERGFPADGEKWRKLTGILS